MADRYISEKALIENIAKVKDLRTLSTKTIGEAISKTPTADVVEVVRCKECEYWTVEKDLGMFFCNHWASVLTCSQADDFCSYGKRKEKNENRLD